MIAKRHSFSFLIVTAIFTLLFPSGSIQAQESTASQDSSAVLFIIDNSGSMADNDPSNLRYTAAKLFISLLDTGDMAGLVTFSSSAQKLTDHLIEIEDVDSRTELLSSIEPSAGSGWTDVKKAFTAAKDLLNASEIGNRQAAIIFLTDGEPAIEDQYSGYETESIQLAGQMSLPVHSIALTSEAESPFLLRLSADTKGSITSAKNANQLLDAFLQILSNLKNRVILGEGSSQAPGSAELFIDPTLIPYIENVNFILSKAETASAKLLDPSGKAVSVSTAGFDLVEEDERFIVIKSSTLQGGNWTFELDGSGTTQARAVLTSRLHAAVQQPGSVHEKGQTLPIVVSLFEEDSGGEKSKVIGDASFSALITQPDGSQESLDAFFDDGTNGDEIAGDGNFTRLYVNTEQTGTYSIEIIGKKGAVPVTARTQTQGIEFPSLILDEPSAAIYSLHGEAIPIAVQLEGGDPQELDSGKFQAVVKFPDGRQQTVSLTRFGTTYTGEFTPDETGKYVIEIGALDGRYQGVAYTHSVRKEISVEIIPLITFTRNGSAFENIDLGRISLSEAREGINLTFSAFSSAERSETIQAKLDGFSGLTIASSPVLTIEAGENDLINILLQIEDGKNEGVMEGRLLFSSADKAEIIPAAVPLRMEIYKPELVFKELPAGGVYPTGCLSKQGQIILNVESNSTETESVLFSLSGDERFSLSNPQALVKPGSSEVILRMDCQDTFFIGGQLKLALEAVPDNDDIIITPDKPLPVTIQLLPVWKACGGEIRKYGMILIAIIIIFLILRRIISNRVKPIPLDGVIWYKKEGSPKYRLNTMLGPLSKHEISIGSGEQCDIRITDGNLLEVHAQIFTKRDGDTSQVYIKPVGPVTVGYSQITDEKMITSNQEFIMGNYIFRYISGSGY